MEYDSSPIDIQTNKTIDKKEICLEALRGFIHPAVNGMKTEQDRSGAKCILMTIESILCLRSNQKYMKRREKIIKKGEVLSKAEEVEKIFELLDIVSKEMERKGIITPPEVST